MLIIRKEQMQVFEEIALKRYEDRVLETIAKAYPERYEQDGEDRMRALVREGIVKSENYGITDDDDAERYILMLVERGLHFEHEDESAECLEILQDKDLDGGAKVGLIHRILQSEGD